MRSCAAHRRCSIVGGAAGSLHAYTDTAAGLPPLPTRSLRRASHRSDSAGLNKEHDVEVVTVVPSPPAPTPRKIFCTRRIRGFPSKYTIPWRRNSLSWARDEARSAEPSGFYCPAKPRYRSWLWRPNRSWPRFGAACPTAVGSTITMRARNCHGGRRTEDGIPKRTREADPVGPLQPDCLILEASRLGPAFPGHSLLPRAQRACARKWRR